MTVAHSAAPAEVVGAAARTGARVDAYVTVLPPAVPSELPAHVARLVAAGAVGLNLYHLGLAPRGRQDLLARVVALTR